MDDLTRRTRDRLAVLADHEPGELARGLLRDRVRRGEHCGDSGSKRDGGRGENRGHGGGKTDRAAAIGHCVTPLRDSGSIGPKCYRRKAAFRIAGFAARRVSFADNGLPRFSRQVTNAGRRVRRAFSAIMTVGALVLPPTSVGMTEASTTERPSMPRTRSAAIDDRQRVGAHAAGPDRVIDRVGAPADLRDEGLVARPLGKQLRTAMRRERRAIHDLARAPHAGHQRLEVLRLREKVRIDARRRARVGRAQPDAAAALRPQDRDVAGNAVAVVQPPGMVVHQADDEMQLDVRPGEVRARAQERARLGKVGRQESRCRGCATRNSRRSARSAVRARDAHEPAVDRTGTRARGRRGRRGSRRRPAVRAAARCRGARAPRADRCRTAAGAAATRRRRPRGSARAPRRCAPCRPAPRPRCPSRARRRTRCASHGGRSAR